MLEYCVSNEKILDFFMKTLKSEPTERMTAIEGLEKFGFVGNKCLIFKHQNQKKTVFRNIGAGKKMIEFQIHQIFSVSVVILFVVVLCLMKIKIKLRK